LDQYSLIDFCETQHLITLNRSCHKCGAKTLFKLPKSFLDPLINRIGFGCGVQTIQDNVGVHSMCLYQNRERSA